MGRKVQGPKPGESIEYVLPDEFNTDPSSPPITARLRVPTEAGRRVVAAKLAKSTDAEDQFEALAFVLRTYVERVDNYENRGVAIVDADSLCEHGEDDIFTDLAVKAMSLMGLSEDERKNSDGRSSSTELKVPPQTGTTTPPQTKADIEAADLAV